MSDREMRMAAVLHGLPITPVGDAKFYFEYHDDETVPEYFARLNAEVFAPKGQSIKRVIMGGTLLNLGSPDYADMTMLMFHQLHLTQKMFSVVLAPTDGAKGGRRSSVRLSKVRTPKTPRSAKSARKNKSKPKPKPKTPVRPKSAKSKKARPTKPKSGVKKPQGRKRM
jgi:hypothetical protein